jgi:hypothetical protein
MNHDDRSPGWACSDCLFVIENDDYPQWMSDSELADYERRVSDTFRRYTVFLGHATEDHTGWHCPRQGGWDEWSDEADDYVPVPPDPDAECDCETLTHSTRTCAVCGVHQGGSWDAITLYPHDKETSS